MRRFFGFTIFFQAFRLLRPLGVGHFTFVPYVPCIVRDLAPKNSLRPCLTPASAFTCLATDPLFSLTTFTMAFNSLVGACSFSFVFLPYQRLVWCILVLSMVASHAESLIIRCFCCSCLSYRHTYSALASAWIYFTAYRYQQTSVVIRYLSYEQIDRVIQSQWSCSTAHSWFLSPKRSQVH
jgi:hypothetical protein